MFDILLLTAKWYFITGIIVYAGITIFEFLMNNEDEPESVSQKPQSMSLEDIIEILKTIVFWPKYLYLVVQFTIVTVILLR